MAVYTEAKGEALVSNGARGNCFQEGRSSVKFPERSVNLFLVVGEAFIACLLHARRIPRILSPFADLLQRCECAFQMEICHCVAFHGLTITDFYSFFLFEGRYT